MSDPGMIATIATVDREGDALTKAWWREVVRIASLLEREPWEEALLDVTIDLEPTMKKNRAKNPLDSADRLLLGVLRLLVLPNPQYPQVDRDKALAILAGQGRPGLGVG